MGIGAGGGTTNYSWDFENRLTSVTRPNGVSTNYQYDNLSRLLSVLHQVGGNTLDGAAYTVDAAGNRLSKSDALAGVTSNYSYDSIYQLTQTVQGLNTTETYSFDAVGNRLSSLGVSPYSYNSSNELTSTPSFGFTYDNNGNTTSKTDTNGTSTYTWDFENRLTAVTLPGTGGTVSFEYDPFGRRIEKVSPARTTVYAYDGENVAEELDGGGIAIARYTQGLGIDEPLALNRTAATSFYEADGLGSITSLTDGSGQIAASYTYDSFGNLTNSTGSIASPFQYTGREFDPETALYYYRARYYDSSTGRFLNQDPIRFRGGINFYGYVGNSPVNLGDPSGLWTPAAHRQMVWNALHPCHVSNEEIWQIQQGSQFIDDHFQGAEYAYMHYMLDGTVNQSPGDAVNATDEFVQHQFGDAVAVLAAGGTSQSMFLLGTAMHPLMDMTSPAHHDAAGLPLPWCGMNPFSCSNLLDHALFENVDMLNAHPEIQEEENAILRSWYEVLTGKSLDCGCNGGKR